MSPAPRTVLIVEDDRIVGEIYSLSLTRAGYRVVVATDGVDGIDKALRERPDFIFVDLRMPRMDGIEMLRVLAQNGTTATIPIVMLSNYDDPVLLQEGRSLGAKDHIVKAGTDPAELPAVVARWLT